MPWKRVDPISQLAALWRSQATSIIMDNFVTSKNPSRANLSAEISQTLLPYAVQVLEELLSCS